MSIQVIDSDCTRCGICVEACPVQIIEMRDKIPFSTSEADELCINCGHCVAVCPFAALSLDTMPAQMCPPVQEEWYPEPNHLELFLRARRSIRAYNKESLERDMLVKLIDAARFAPTGSNSQRVYWLVVYEREKVEAMAGMTIEFIRSGLKSAPSSAQTTALQRIVSMSEAGYDYICRGAPHLVLAHAPEPRGSTDCVIALAYLELIAFSLGLGPCWAGYITYAAQNWPPIQRFLRLPEGHKIFGAMMIGYPKYKYHRLPHRDQARIDWVT